MRHLRIVLPPLLAVVLLLSASPPLQADGPQQSSVGLKAIVLQLERQYREPLDVMERLILPERSDFRMQTKVESAGATTVTEPPGVSLFSVLDLSALSNQTETPSQVMEPPPESYGGPVLVEAPRPAPTVRPQAVQAATSTGWQWPTRSRLITDAFGVRRTNGYHGGIDIADRWKAPVSAIGPGVVVFAGNSGATYGLSVMIQHPNGWVSRYAHLSGVYPRTGDRVVAGQPLGQMGDSGYAFGTHLHLEIIVNGNVIDPLTVLPRN